MCVGVVQGEGLVVAKAVVVTVVVSLVVLVGVSGCAKHAPTSYELDVRAGRPVPPQDWRDKHYRGRRSQKPPRGQAGAMQSWSSNSTLAPATSMPARVDPVVKRVWVADRLLPDGSWLQGTWMYVEVEPARWLYEVDPFSSPFAQPPRSEVLP